MAAIAKKRVLLVDDDPELLESVRIALMMRGYEVLTACDGAEALARVERDRPDLMVLDLVMPRRSGLTVLDRMHRTAMRSTPIIMMTANEEERHRDAAKLRGVSVFLSKPFAIEQLISEVETILNA
jgi:DNA-binding response OmpR family regulator